MDQGFTEIHTPKILPGASEGGASCFRVPYFNREACLAQSPQLYKQMCIAGDMQRVFEIGELRIHHPCHPLHHHRHHHHHDRGTSQRIRDSSWQQQLLLLLLLFIVHAAAAAAAAPLGTGPVFRAENSNTHRHLCEFVGLDLEMEIKESYIETVDLVDELFKYIFKQLETHATKVNLPTSSYCCCCGCSCCCCLFLCLLSPGVEPAAAAAVAAVAGVCLDSRAACSPSFCIFGGDTAFHLLRGCTDVA